MGLLTDYRSNFLKLGYNYSPFQSQSKRGYQLKDEFHQMDLSCRYTLKNKVRLAALLPVGYKSRTIADAHQSEQGLGDLQINAAYVLLENKALKWNTNLYLEAGLGISLPTAKYDDDIHDKDLPRNFNMGTGALGYSFQSNAVWTYKTYGLVANAFYQLNTETQAGYKFGNQFSTRLTAFNSLDWGKLQWIPNVGLGYEIIGKDRFSNNNTVTDSGGKGLLFYAGLNVKSNRFLTSASYALPLVEEYGDGSTDIQGRISFQISYLF